MKEYEEPEDAGLVTEPFSLDMHCDTTKCVAALGQAIAEDGLWSVDLDTLEV